VRRRGRPIPGAGVPRCAGQSGMRSTGLITSPASEAFGASFSFFSGTDLISSWLD
jgi:hypothetical protein